MPSRELRLIANARGALRLEPRERARALRALGWLIAADAMVRLVPYATLTRRMARLSISRSPSARMTPAECAVAIRRAAATWPMARCLPRAVAGYCLLKRAGLRPTVNVGVAVAVDDRRLDAHAWLECDGVTVTGGDVAPQYVRLTPDGRPFA